ncbi:DUF2505 domain-containing protein [Nocardioides sp.]|jgi:hypothetical protein|uniref:DUF2505 domain-containing protein n=1 Tax=Nocardioides sp. TaxID=35761 RepID=UPI002C91AC6D|nr:DUF2505 domain-containing protein [Nocardioides sp.]HVX54677.1 DUF2505 domain-containing protein [Nocardioides sp.]
MSTTVTFDMTYDAPLAAVTAMLADAAFREAVCDAQHATSRSVSISGIPGTVDVTFTQQTEGIPSFAQKFVGSTVTVSQHETWSTAHAATLDIDAGVPIAAIKGSVAVAERGAQTVETVTMQVTVKVPLVGGKLESLVADMMRKALTKEYAVGKSYLAG